MGCSVSKMEDDGEAAAGLGHPIRRRIEEIRRRRMFHGGRVGKDSFVSTTELLRREEEDDATTFTTEEEASRECSLHCDVVCSACGGHVSSLPRESTSSWTPPTMAVLPPLAEGAEGARTEEVEAVVASHGCAGGSAEIEEEDEGAENKKKHEVEGDDEAETVTKEADDRDQRERGEEQGKEEKGRKKKQKDEVGKGGASLAGGRRRLGYDEAEMPGSPSFRVYFVDSLHESGDDDSAHSGGSYSGKADRKDGVCSTTSEDSGEGKSTRRRRRGRRLKSLRRGPNAMYGLLNVRSCYSHRGNGAHPPPTPALHAEKVA